MEAGEVNRAASGVPPVPPWEAPPMGSPAERQRTGCNEQEPGWQRQTTRHDRGVSDCDSGLSFFLGFLRRSRLHGVVFHDFAQ
jgi:hypothetical protein